MFSRESSTGHYLLKEGLGEDEKRRIIDVLTRSRRTSKFAETVTSVSAIIMTLVPQGLVLSITLIFIVGIVRISRKGALVQKPNSIESMVHVNVICMDKTGTLTRNRLALKEIVTVPEGDAAVRDLIRVFASNSEDKNKTMEAIEKSLGGERAEVLDAIPFTSLNKYSALRFRHGGDVHDMIVGASSTTRAMFTHPDPDILEQDIVHLSRQGYRVIICAVKKGDTSTPLRESLRGFAFRALIVLEDEIKPEAGEILEYFRKRNIDLKIISGDHPETVMSIARTLNLPNADRSVTGSDLERMGPGEFERAVMESAIFARVNPQQKLDIIKTLQKKQKVRGHGGRRGERRAGHQGGEPGDLHGERGAGEQGRFGDHPGP